MHVREGYLSCVVIGIFFQRHSIADRGKVQLIRGHCITESCRETMDTVSDHETSV